MIQSLVNNTNTQQSLERLFEWIRRCNQNVEGVCRTDTIHRDEGGRGGRGMRMGLSF